ncbi:MAG: PIN domain-containing protein [Thermoleophilia bacterium]|nr:PIN domain-containing protein [Thermoleophilia bacterium]
MKLVLDADVLIGALDGSDPHHAQARALFIGWQEQNATRLISVVNLSEVLVAPAADRRRLRAAREAIATLGVAIHQPGEPIGVEAARLRSAHPLSLPDAYCLATARYADASVVSFDQNVLRAAALEGVATAVTAVRRQRQGGR